MGEYPAACCGYSFPFECYKNTPKHCFGWDFYFYKMVKEYSSMQEFERDSNARLMQVLLVTIIALLIIFFLFLAYYIYMNIPGSPQQLNAVVEKESPGNQQAEIKLSEVVQFYPNMKFNHNNISYRIDVNCAQEKKERMKNALDIISSDLGLISFYQVSADPDIDIVCSGNPDVPQDGDYFVAGEGGAREIIQTGKYNIITNGLILLYENSRDTIKCDGPNVELHELMHVFGFNHSISKDSLMYPLLNSCDQVLDSSILDKLKELYSEENLADLYFDNISVIKKGRYLDFNITIKNSGDVDAENVNYSVLDDGELVDTREIGEIKYGAGVAIKVMNFKLIHKNPSEIIFDIDPSDSIKESDKKNNIARIALN